jgi:membrane fusion protein, heavy metal efflux system
MKQNTPIAKTVLWLLALAVAIVLGRGIVQHVNASRSESSGREIASAQPGKGGVELTDRPNTIRVSPAAIERLDIVTGEVKPAPPPVQLRLTGSLLLDPSLLVRVHARFSGELVSLGTAPVNRNRPDDRAAGRRALQYEDKVSKNQVLAIVWSKEIGEKKSELVDAISKMDNDQKLLRQYENAPLVVSERTIHEARRNYEADLIAVAKAERTLRSWRLTEGVIQQVHQEAKRVEQRQTSDPQADRTWAEIEVRSPIDGLILEKNFNVGDIVDPTQDMFKVADLSRILVVANAYEEDLPLLRALRPDQRTWRVDIKADPNDVPMTGSFDIGNIIDPTQHSGAVMGSLDNPSGRLSVGEFITATIDLPADPSLVSVPAAALIEDNHTTQVFVVSGTDKNEFTLRKVAVVNRGREHVLLRAHPRPAEQADGAEPLKAGEQIIQSGAAALTAQIRALEPPASERGALLLRLRTPSEKSRRVL